MNIDAVLIDDNPWIRDLWELHGKKIGKIFRTCASFVEFCSFHRQVDRRVPIFVDLRLGDDSETDGKKLIRNLSGLGFKSLFLATAYRVEESPEDIGVCAVVGKEPPNWLLSADTATQSLIDPTAPNGLSSLTADRKKQLRMQMSPDAIARFNSRMAKLYDAIYASESSDFAATPPNIVIEAWENAIYLELNDEELKNQIDQAWRRSFGL